MGDMAVIQCEQGKEDLYRIGDTVTGGWVLNKIFSNRIIITNYDSSIVVPMSMLGGNGFDDPEEEEGPLTAAEGADAIKRKALKRLESQEFRDKLAVYLNGRHPTEVEFPLGVKSHGITAISENEFDIERQAVLWQLIINPLDHYFKYTLEENGFQFTEIVPGSLFDASEFRTGDQIIKVNNKKVRNPTDLGRFFLDNMNSQLLTIDFYRGDVAMVHYYYMK
jgi:type II secretory pathway component PulC